MNLTRDLESGKSIRNYALFLTYLAGSDNINFEDVIFAFSVPCRWLLPVDLRNSWADPRMTLQSRSVHRNSPTKVRPSVMRIRMFLFRSPSSFCRARDEGDKIDGS